MYGYKCDICGCSLDPGEGRACDECAAKMDSTSGEFPGTADRQEKEVEYYAG